MVKQLWREGGGDWESCFCWERAGSSLFFASAAAHESSGRLCLHHTQLILSANEGVVVVLVTVLCFFLRILLGLPPSLLITTQWKGKETALDCQDFFCFVNAELVRPGLGRAAALPPADLG